jgi:molybdate/tungstate transport system substrate-binding protein
MNKNRYTLFPVLSVLIFLLSCNFHKNPQPINNQEITGDVIIFHAGSLSVPFQKIARAFEAANPGVKVLLEAAGSVDCARKITELHKPCDLMASSDYKVITNYLIPNYASWFLPFAGNEMVIAFTDKSTSGNIITKDNWADILLNPQVRYGRSDPDADPCGYRTVMVMQLAGNFYGKPDLAGKLSSKDNRYIRPKEVDLLAMLELHETDYIFIYKSVAIQHNLKFIELPDEINLKKMEMEDQYKKAVVSIKGKTPGSTTEVSGEAILYAVTQIKGSPNPKAAEAFLNFLLDKDKGIRILEDAGHNSLIPVKETEEMNLPAPMKRYTIH